MEYKGEILIYFIIFCTILIFGEFKKFEIVADKNLTDLC